MHSFTIPSNAHQHFILIVAWLSTISTTIQYSITAKLIFIFRFRWKLLLAKYRQLITVYGWEKGNIFETPMISVLVIQVHWNACMLYVYMLDENNFYDIYSELNSEHYAQKQPYPNGKWNIIRRKPPSLRWNRTKWSVIVDVIAFFYGFTWAISARVRAHATNITLAIIAYIAILAFEIGYAIHAIPFHDHDYVHSTPNECVFFVVLWAFYIGLLDKTVI